MALGDLLSDLSAFSNPYGAPATGEWNLARGIFTTKSRSVSVEFFYERKDPSRAAMTALSETSDSGGRRLAVFEYPYVSGARAKDLGRKAETYTFQIKFFGPSYQSKFQDFLGIINTDEGGYLTHPTRSGASDSGSIPVRFRDYEFIHRHDEWNAVTIRATFVEDQTDQILTLNAAAPSQDSAIRAALQTLVSTQASVSNSISTVSALLLLPAAISNAMQLRLSSITDQTSRLVGQIAATFSTSSEVATIAADAATNGVSILGLTSSTVSTSSGASNIPPVYQVGFDDTSKAAFSTRLSDFVSANTINSQQAVFLANRTRSSIKSAILDAESTFGTQSYDIMLAYRQLAVSIQSMLESALASQQANTRSFVVPHPMSLRQVAFLNGLTPDDQNVIAALNPDLGSVNYLPRGAVVTVPAA